MYRRPLGQPQSLPMGLGQQQPPQQQLPQQLSQLGTGLGLGLGGGGLGVPGQQRLGQQQPLGVGQQRPFGLGQQQPLGLGQHQQQPLGLGQQRLGQQQLGMQPQPQPQLGLGVAAAGGVGSRNPPYNVTPLANTGITSQNRHEQPQQFHFHHIAAMPPYQAKSQEELHWEDMQLASGRIQGGQQQQQQQPQLGRAPLGQQQQPLGLGQQQQQQRLGAVGGLQQPLGLVGPQQTQLSLGQLGQRQIGGQQLLGGQQQTLLGVGQQQQHQQQHYQLGAGLGGQLGQGGLQLGLQQQLSPQPGYRPGLQLGGQQPGLGQQQYQLGAGRGALQLGARPGGLQIGGQQLQQRPQLGGGGLLQSPQLGAQLGLGGQQYAQQLGLGGQQQYAQQLGLGGQQQYAQQLGLGGQQQYAQRQQYLTNPEANPYAPVPRTPRPLENLPEEDGDQYLITRTNPSRRTPHTTPHYKVAPRTGSRTSRTPRATENYSSPLSSTHHTAWSETRRNATAAANGSLASATRGTGTWVSRKSVTKLLLSESAAGGDLAESDSEFSDSESEEMSDPRANSSKGEHSPYKPDRSFLATAASDRNDSVGKEDWDELLSEIEVGSEPEDDVVHDAGYYVFPSIRDLSKMEDDQLANLRELIIGRHGKGEVSWTDVDVRGLDLDRSVLISQGMVCVHPSPQDLQVYNQKEPKDQRAPLENVLEEPWALGQGLNKPATISLVGLFPKASTGRSTEEKMAERHVRKLKRTPNTNFVSFEPTAGKWTFTVEHF